MFPKKGRKSVTVDGVLYYYIVKRLVVIYIQNSETNQKYSWYHEIKRKWEYQFKPSDIVSLIKNKELYEIPLKKI